MWHGKDRPRGGPIREAEGRTAKVYSKVADEAQEIGFDLWRAANPFRPISR